MRLAAIFALLATSLLAASAHADPSATSGPSAAVLAGYALEPDTIAGGDVDAYRIGIGARVGTTLPAHVYLGGTFVVHFGSDVRASGDGGARYDARYHVSYGGGEAGYDFDIRRRFLVRPYAGIGLLASVGHSTVAHAQSTGKDVAFFYLAPGVLAAYRLGDAFAGLDVRMPLPFAEEPIRWAPAVLLTAGARL